MKMGKFAALVAIATLASFATYSVDAKAG